MLLHVVPASGLQKVLNLTHQRTRWQVLMHRWLAWSSSRTARSALSEGAKVVTRRGHTVLANEPKEFSSLNTIDANARIVIAALAEAGIEHTASLARAMRPRVVSVRDGDADRVLAAVSQYCRGKAVYAATVSPSGGIGTPILAASLSMTDLRPRPATTGTSVAWTLRVFTFQASSGQILGGEALGCDILFRRSAAPAHGSSAIKPSPAVASAETRTQLGRTKPLLSDVDFPIDAVYTWVDGQDPDWNRTMNAYRNLETSGTLNTYAANDARFHSRDELKYSLRSLEYYAGWVRHIYLVTAGQVPSWLNQDHPWITVIDHRDIFDDASMLPTFNSHAIESQLHHIDGLSEQFLYINDDVFFGRPVVPELFFEPNGASRFFLSGATIGPEEASVTDLPVDAAAKRARSLIEQSFGRTIECKFQHVVHAQRISTLREIERRFPEAIEQTAGARFRSPTDVSLPSSFAHYFGLATGAAVAGTMNYRYCDIATTTAGQKLFSMLLNRKADIFCLNEVGSDHDDRDSQDEMVKRFLEEYYPIASSLELR